MAGIGASFNALVKRQTSFVRSAADEWDAGGAGGATGAAEVDAYWCVHGGGKREEEIINGRGVTDA